MIKQLAFVTLWVHLSISTNPFNKNTIYRVTNCQALSISQSLNLPLSLRDRDRADTIITFHPPPPPPTENFLST